MRIAGIEIKRRVWIAIGFTLGVIGIWWVGLSPRIPPTEVAARPKQPSVILAGSVAESADVLLVEKAKYFDPTPLFFPTEWNFGQTALRESMKRQPGQVFQSFDPQFVSDDFKSVKHEIDSAELPGRLNEVVVTGNEAPFAGLGEQSREPLRLPERGSFLEIRNLHDNRTLITQSMKIDSGFPPDFAPLEFLVVVGTAGLVAEPVLMNGSDGEEVDNLLRNYLAKSFRVGERLAPGAYRILIGP